MKSSTQSSADITGADLATQHPRPNPGAHSRDRQPPTRDARPPISRLIDLVTDALGHEAAFAGAGIMVVIGLLVGGLWGIHLTTLSAIAALVTFVMVFAVQHTSSRESRALNLKLDELIRVSHGRNELIGAEDETHMQLEERRQRLLEERDP